MKNKIVLGCFIAASMLAMPSCSDFLTENPKGKLTPENFFSNQNELDMSVYALYAKVQASQCNSNPMIVQCQGDDVTSQLRDQTRVLIFLQMPLNLLLTQKVLKELGVVFIRSSRQQI